jgi:hypothetical protein
MFFFHVQIINTATWIVENGLSWRYTVPYVVYEGCRHRTVEQFRNYVVSTIEYYSKKRITVYTTFVRKVPKLSMLKHIWSTFPEISLHLPKPSY